MNWARNYKPNVVVLVLAVFAGVVNARGQGKNSYLNILLFGNSCSAERIAEEGARGFTDPDG